MRIEAWSGARRNTAARPVALVVSLALGVGLLVAPSGSAFASAAAPGAGAPGTIQTVAGGVGGPGPATGISVSSPCAVSFRGGQLYVGQGVIRAISLRTDRLSTPAGAQSMGGPGRGGGPAGAAGFSWTCGLTADHHGNLLIADGADYYDGHTSGGDNLVRVLATKTGTFYGQKMRAGHVYTIAGNGTRGFAGDGAPATAAELAGPAGIAVDAAGNVVFADAGNGRLRVIAEATGTFYGQAMTSGDIYTIAGNGLRGFAGDGGPATAATLAISPTGQGNTNVTEPWPVVAIDRAGNVVLADTFNCRVRVVAASTGRFYGRPMTTGDIYSIAGSTGTSGQIACGPPGDGGPARQAKLGILSGLALDRAGNLVIADMTSERIWVMATASGRFYGRPMSAGHVYLVAGTGGIGSKGDNGVATKSEFRGPTGVTVDSAGNIIVADGQGYGGPLEFNQNNNRVQAIAVRSGRFYGQAMRAGHVYTIAGTRSFPTGMGGPAIRAQISTGPQQSGMALDRSGNLVLAAVNHVLVVAARSGRFYGRAMLARHIYSVAGGGRSHLEEGVLAGQASFGDLSDVAVDHAGNVLMAVYGSQQLWVLAVRAGRYYGLNMRPGRLYLVAGDGAFFSTGNGGPARKASVTPTAVAVDPNGNVIITDNPYSMIRVVAVKSGRFFGQSMKAGDIYSIAGNYSDPDNGASGILGTSAGILPLGGTTDAAGNVIFADLQSARVRVLAQQAGTYYGQPMKAGFIYTIAGDGDRADSGDGGPAVAAGTVPETLAVDPAGNVLLTDTGNVARVVAVRTGRFYGRQMTAGDIYHLAGGGTQSLGDGGPASLADLAGLAGIVVARSGAVYIDDGARVREISPWP